MSGFLPSPEDYIGPDDFTEDIFREVAELVYEQHAQGEINPAQIISRFTDEEQQPGSRRLVSCPPASDGDTAGAGESIKRNDPQDKETQHGCAFQKSGSD